MSIVISMQSIYTYYISYPSLLVLDFVTAEGGSTFPETSANVYQISWRYIPFKVEDISS
jgi:hypothetical protein